jgi:hypothetical protein
MPAKVPCQCPVEGCQYLTYLDMGALGGLTYVAAHANLRTELRAEHPDHPPLPSSAEKPDRPARTSR